MASTYTAAGIELIAQGEQAGAWGATTNTNWELVEEMIGGVVDITLTGSTYSLVTTDATSSEGRHSVLNFSGSPGATCTVTVTPNDMQKVYFVVNGSDETVTISQGSGANVSVSAGKNKIVFCDGAGAGAAVTDISSGFDATTLAELGVTASAAELNTMDGITATVDELNLLDGVTATTTELNYVDGVTSSIQTQLDAKQASATAVTTSTSFGGDVSGTYNAIVVADDSHNHVISNVDGLQTALDAKAALAGATFTGTVTGTDLTLSGNLTVNGSTITNNTTNTTIDDTLIELGNGTTGTPANDAGLVIERGDLANAFIGFDESADKFTVGTGTFTGSSTGNLTISTGTLVANIEGNVTGNVTGNTSGSSGSCTGNAATATTLQTARTIGGVSFDGSANINLPGVNTAGNQNTSGNAATATALATARTIGGVSFDGTANINLPGVNTAGNQNTSGNAATATALATARSIGLGGDLSGSANFDGTAGITITASLGANTVDSSELVDNSVDASHLNVSGNGTTAQFLRSDGDGSFTWATPTDTNTTYSGGGNYGIYLSGTEIRLENDRRRNATGEDVYSGNTHDYTFYDASVGIRWYTAGAEEMRLENDGDLHVDGNVTAYSTTVSDERLKTDIERIEGALGKVCALSGYTFTYKHDGKASAGVVAQEVEKVMPSAVIEKELPYQGEEGEQYKIVQYDQLHGLLIEAIKELKAEVAELKAKVG